MWFFFLPRSTAVHWERRPPHLFLTPAHPISSLLHVLPQLSGGRFVFFSFLFNVTLEIMSTTPVNNSFSLTTNVVIYLRRLPLWMVFRPQQFNQKAVWVGQVPLIRTSFTYLLLSCNRSGKNVLKVLWLGRSVSVLLPLEFLVFTLLV